LDQDKKEEKKKRKTFFCDRKRRERKNFNNLLKVVVILLTNFFLKISKNKNRTHITFWKLSYLTRHHIHETFVYTKKIDFIILFELTRVENEKEEEEEEW